MEDILTQITNPNVVLETIATQSSYLEARKSIEEKRVMTSDDVCSTESHYQIKTEAEYVQQL
jgi:hypothetical protein